MQLTLKAEVSDVAYKTGRFVVNVEVLHDPFPDEYYRHFKIKKSNDVRYRHFDGMVDVTCALPKTRENIKSASMFASAREYYRSKSNASARKILRRSHGR